MRTVIFLAIIVCSSLLSAATVSGTFACDGSPAPTIRLVMAFDAVDSTQLASQQTDAAGAYSFDIADGIDVMLIGFASRGKTEGGYTLHEYTPAVKLVPAVSGAVTADLRTVPARHFIFEGRKNGTLVTGGSFPNMFPFDGTDRALPTFSVGAEKSGQAGQVPSYNIALGGVVSFFVEWELPEAGRIMVRLDNGGDGYPVTEQGGVILDLNREAAFSAVMRLHRLLEGRGETYPDAMTALETAQELFDGGSYDAAAGKAIVAAEALAVALSKADIAKYRQGTLEVTVTDTNGHPLPGATVQVTQGARQFLFGLLPNLPNGGAEFMQTLYDDGITFGTAGVLWKDIEPTDDNYSWYGPDTWFGIPVLDEMGYTLTGHSLVYFLDRIMPEYLLTLEGQALLAEIAEHSGVVVDHYKEVMDEWILINEAHSYPASRGLTRAEITAVSKAAYDAVTAAAPGVPTMVNAAPDWFGQSIVTELLLPDHETFFTLPLKPYFESLHMSVPFDRIGQQMYNGGCVTLFADHGMGAVGVMPVYDLAELRRQLLSLAELGLPIHLSEISIPAATPTACSGMGYWHAPWDETVQADYLEAFYTMVFGIEPLRSITYWDLLDKDSFVNTGGLFREDLTPKPAYERLRSLLAQWRTETTLETADGGTATTAAFAGGYHLTATYDGKSAEIDIALAEQTTLPVTLVISGVEAPDDLLPDDIAVDEDAVPTDTDTTKSDGGCGCHIVL